MPESPIPSFEQIYSTYKNKVFNTVIGYLQHPENAEEVTQDVFVEVYRSLHAFKGDSALGTWIYRIAVNKSLDFIRSGKRKKRFGLITALLDGNAPQEIQPADFIHPGVLLENKERSVILFKAIGTLPDSQKTAFILSKLEQQGNKEIADIMQLGVGAVESLLSRARENLKKQLASYYKT
jgi:RNA polymerase sigma-70 factor, ECF subfamily